MRTRTKMLMNGVLVAAVLIAVTGAASMPAQATERPQVQSDVASAAAAADVTTPPFSACTAEETKATQRWWYFGNNAGMDFGVNGAAPSAVRGPLVAQEGTTVVTDTTGALQFMSNGQEVYDRNGSVMPNGSGLLGNRSSTQTVSAFPAFGNPGKYFVVATAGEIGAGPGALTYSVVTCRSTAGWVM